MSEFALYARDVAAEDRPIAMLVSKQRIVGPTNGSSAYVLALAKTIRDSGFDVWLIQPSAQIAGRTPVLRMSDDLTVFARHEILAMERIGHSAIAYSPAVWWGFVTGAFKLIARKLLGNRGFLADRPRPYSIALPWNGREKLFVEQHAALAGERLKLVIADYVFSTEAFAHVPTETRTAIIMHDLFCRRDGKGQDSVALLEERAEVDLLNRADWVLAIQSEEQAFVEQNCPHSEAILAGMPALIVDEPQPGHDDRLLFIGSDTAPNSVGLTWFCEEVWPRVLKSRPQARLDVVGTVGRKFENAAYPQVRFLGLVDDLTAVYRDAGILLSPLTFGSGLKIKLVEAMGHGKAIVATPVTLQGVEDICEGAVINESEPGAMAEAIIALAGKRDARGDLGARALECARQHFSAQSVHAELREKLGALAAGRD